MENLNPEKKSLKEIANDVEGKNIKIVLVGDITDDHHRVAAFIASKEFMVIRMENLTDEDREKVFSADREKETDTSPFRIPPIPIKSMEQFRDDVVLDEKKYFKKDIPFSNLKVVSSPNKRAFVPKFKIQRGRR